MGEGRAPEQVARPEETFLRGEITALVPDLRAFARFLARDPSSADDLVQDALMRALGALAQFRPGTNLKAWLFTILRNEFYQQARRRKREAAALQSRFPPPENARPTQEGTSAVRELARLIWTLPPLQREALVLVGAQGMSYEEAALVCGVPVGTVKARVSRGRATLAASVQGEAREDR